MNIILNRGFSVPLLREMIEFPLPERIREILLLHIMPGKIMGIEIADAAGELLVAPVVGVPQISGDREIPASLHLRLRLHDRLDAGIALRGGGHIACRLGENDLRLRKAHPLDREKRARRYYQTVLDFKAEKVGEAAVKKIELLMNDLGITPADRKVAVIARQKAEETSGPALALELPNGEIVTGKNSELFGPTAAALINAIKKSADIAKEVKLIEPEVVKPIQGLKIDHLGSRNPRLHSNEILIALAITATENPDAARAMEELGNLKGSEAHSTIILTDEDKNVLRKLGINVTFDPFYQYDRLYRK